MAKRAAKPFTWFGFVATRDTFLSSSFITTSHWQRKQVSSTSLSQILNIGRIFFYLICKKKKKEKEPGQQDKNNCVLGWLLFVVEWCFFLFYGKKEYDNIYNVRMFTILKFIMLYIGITCTYKLATLPSGTIFLNFSWNPGFGWE